MADLFVGIFSVRLVYPVRIKMLVQQDIISYHPGKKQCAAGRLDCPVDKWTDHRKCALILLTMKHDALYPPQLLETYGREKS